MRAVNEIRIRRCILLSFVLIEYTKQFKLFSSFYKTENEKLGLPIKTWTVCQVPWFRWHGTLRLY